MKCEIVEINFGHPSFSWANGTYIIVGPHQNSKTEIEICPFKNGEPDRYDSGDLNISVTGKNNAGIKRTGKFYNLISLEDRERKLKRILEK